MYLNLNTQTPGYDIFMDVAAHRRDSLSPATLKVLDTPSGVDVGSVQAAAVVEEFGTIVAFARAHSPGTQINSPLVGPPNVASQQAHEELTPEVLALAKLLELVAWASHSSDPLKPRVTWVDLVMALGTKSHP